MAATLGPGRFLGAAVDAANYPQHDLPELALVGRSNVGKSSLINALTGQKGLARTSNQPGRTRAIHFYALGARLGLVDLPGYGYAAVSRTERSRWGPMIETLVRQRANIVGLIHVLDARHAPTENDQQAASWLAATGLPVLAVATKIDKVPKTRRPKRQAEMERSLGRAVLLYSAEAREGQNALCAALLALTGRGGDRPIG